MNILPKSLFEEHYLGLSLNQSSVRAVEINNNKQIVASTQIPLEHTVFSQGNLNKEGLSQALKQLLSSAHFSSHYAAISIPEYYSFTRTYSIPKIPLSEVSEALTWQIEKIFPLPKNEIYFDWKLLSQDETTLHLLIVAMPRTTLDQLIEVFESVNIKAISFEPSASSLTQIINIRNSQPTILIEINQFGSSATLIENNVSVLTITNQFSPNQDSRASLQKTSQGIQSLITYHSNNHPQDQIPLQFLLTGDSATQELSQWLAGYVNQPISILQIDSIPPEFQQAYAAASSCIKQHEPGLSLNLLPTQLQEMYDATRHKQKLLSQAKMIISLAVISLISSGFIILMVFMQARNLQTQLQQIEQANSQFSYDAQIVSRLNKNSTQIVQLFARKTTPVNVYKDLFESLPETITVKNLVYEADSQSFVITGTAEDRSSLLNFKEVLEASDRFSDVRLPLESLEKPRNVDFQLTTTLTPVTTN